MYILSCKKTPINYSLKSKNLQGEKTDKPSGKMESLLKTGNFYSFHRSENIRLNDMAEEHEYMKFTIISFITEKNT